MRAECQGAARKIRRPVSNDGTATEDAAGKKEAFPLLGAYDLCLKCSHLFNILDARGAISVTERVGVIARVRALAVGIAKAYVDQQSDERPAEQKPDSRKKQRQGAEVAPEQARRQLA